ncbi:MAG: hypothetical protein JO305_02190 [Alphaproteobacteria bacterium]|nr:hypothetical protein [Alphaproteobacteria bacterium]
MADGGMGSLKFPRNRPATRHEIRQLAEASFEDDDGVPVSMTLTGDEAGNLLELDVFEADGSPLRRYPKPDQIKRIHRDGKLGYPA